MSILSKFKQLFASGSDDAFNDKESVREPVDPDSLEDMTEKVEKQDTSGYYKKNSYTIKEINKKVDSAIYELLVNGTDLLKTLSSSELNGVEYLKVLTDTVNKIVETVDPDGTIALQFKESNDTLSDSLSAEIMKKLIRISRMAQSQSITLGNDLTKELKVTLSKINTTYENYDNLKKLIDFLAQYTTEYGKFRRNMQIFIESAGFDFNDFSTDAFNVIKLYKYLVSKNISEVSLNEKTALQKLLNDFIKKYSANKFLVSVVGQFIALKDTYPRSSNLSIIDARD